MYKIVMILRTFWFDDWLWTSIASSTLGVDCFLFWGLSFDLFFFDSSFLFELSVPYTWKLFEFLPEDFSSFCGDIPPYFCFGWLLLFLGPYPTDDDWICWSIILFGWRDLDETLFLQFHNEFVLASVCFGVD